MLHYNKYVFSTSTVLCLESGIVLNILEIENIPPIEITKKIYKSNINN